MFKTYLLTKVNMYIVDTLQSILLESVKSWCMWKYVKPAKLGQNKPQSLATTEYCKHNPNKEKVWTTED